jgi:hypothetical protein
VTPPGGPEGGYGAGMAPYEHLLLKRDGDTVRITMNRPQRRNTLT